MDVGIHPPFGRTTFSGKLKSLASFLGEGGSVDPETLEIEQTLDEAFENVIELYQDSTPLDEDWIIGEFDIA